MLEQSMFNFILEKIHDAGVNPDSIKIKGNFNYVMIGDSSEMFETATHNAYDISKEQFIPMALTISKEIAFVEANNRSDWLQQYALMFPESKTEAVLAVLQNLRDYFYDNPTHSITDDSTTYKYAFKVSRPEKVFTSPPQAGEVWHTYIMQFQATSIVSGKFCDEHVITMKKTGGAYASIDWDTITIQTGISMNPSNKITDTDNMTNAPIGRNTSGTMEINYDGSTLNKDIYKVVSGKLDRTTVFFIKDIFDGITHEYEVYISGGSYVLKKRAVYKILFTWVEK
jgi:hypothetical protein